MDKLRFNKESYEDLIAKMFGFVERNHEMRRGSVRTSGSSDARDAALVVRYSRDDLRFDVAWSDFELSLAILMRFDKADVSRQERLVFFEPFVEFLTEGKDRAIVPYVMPKMTTGELKSVASRREAIFENGLEPVADSLARKVQGYFDKVESPDKAVLHAYHMWMQGET